MATNTAVIVLSPNGRRQTVKVTPNTTILQIIEEVCKKQGYKAEDYDIKHHKKILDISSTLRFSGLPNNAQLELVESTRLRAEGDVTLALQLENGSRLVDTFTPNNTLWDVLNKLSPDDLIPDKNSVIIYMRRELYGLETFQKTDLRSLGLTQGRAMFRLIHKLPEDLKTQANISAPLPSKPVEEKPYIRKLQKVESLEKKTEVQEPMKSKDYQSLSTNNDFLAETKQESSQPTLKRKDVTLKKHENCIDIIKKEKKKKQYAEKQLEVMEVDDSYSIPPAKLDDEFIFLGERNAMAFSLETAQKIPSEDLPEDFFELTIDDAKRLLRDIKRRRVQFENGQLMTTAMRNLEESKRQLRNLNTYKKSIIRVQFPDRIILQGTFLPAENIGTVIEFVRDYLEDKTLDFHLFTTPPKNILRRESRLIEIGCVPGALLHFGTNGKQNGKFLRNDVLNKLTSSSIASLAASKMRQQETRQHTSVASDEDDEDDEDLLSGCNDVNVGANTSGAAAASDFVDYDKPSTSTAKEQLPKWFKPSK